MSRYLGRLGVIGRRAARSRALPLRRLGVRFNGLLVSLRHTDPYSRRKALHFLAPRC